VRQLAFLDANVLAKPFTRTMIVVGAAEVDADYVAGWSKYAETEGNRHLRSQAKPLDIFRFERGIALSKTGTDAGRYTDTDPKDRQILADAVAADTRWLVTENVPDFGWNDLRRTGVTAIHFDMFLAEHLSVEAYRQALGILSHSRVSIESIHSSVALLHPRLFAAMADVFPGVEPMLPHHKPPREVIRTPEK